MALVNAFLSLIILQINIQFVFSRKPFQNGDHLVPTAVAGDDACRIITSQIISIFTGNFVSRINCIFWVRENIKFREINFKRFIIFWQRTSNTTWHDIKISRRSAIKIFINLLWFYLNLIQLKHFMICIAARSFLQV